MTFSALFKQLSTDPSSEAALSSPAEDEFLGGGAKQDKPCGGMLGDEGAP